MDHTHQAIARSSWRHVSLFWLQQSAAASARLPLIMMRARVPARDPSREGSWRRARGAKGHRQRRSACICGSTFPFQ